MTIPQKYPMGQKVHKEFEGYDGVFEGTVIFYNEDFGLYKIRYEDGDTEDMDEQEMDRYVAGAAKDKQQDAEYSDGGEEEEEEEDDDGDDNVKTKRARKGTFTLEEKEYALDLASRHKKGGSGKVVDHATFLPALAKALEQNEDYARRLYACAKTYQWNLAKRGGKYKVKATDLTAPKKREASSSSAAAAVVAPPKKKVKQTVEIKGTLTYNDSCRVHLIRGWINPDSKAPEKIMLVRNLDHPEDDPKQLPADGTFHTANFDQEVHIRFKPAKLGLNENTEYRVQGDGGGEEEGTYEIAGTATLNAAAAGDEPVYDLVLRKEYLTLPVKKAPPSEPKKTPESTKKTEENPVNDLTKEFLGIVRKIKKQKFAWPFLEPVSLDDVPDYLDVIKDPIDLSTIEKQIQKGDHYTTKQMLRADLQRMANNCTHYNRDDPSSPYLECASDLTKFLGTLFVDEEEP